MKKLNRFCITMLFVLAAGTAQAEVDSAGNVVEQEAAAQLAAGPISNIVIPYASFSGTVQGSRNERL